MKIFLLYATAGHGHKKAAEYVIETLKNQHPEADVRGIDFLDYTPPHFKILYPGTYEFLVTYLSWFWGFAYEFLDIKAVAYLLNPIRRIFNKVHAWKLEKFLIDENPDVLAFTHFFPPERAVRLKKKGKITSKLVTIVTDFLPHSTWINAGTDYYITMTEEGEKALQSWGIDEGKIKLFGIPVSAKFDFKNQKKETRSQLGLDPNKFTVLLTSGAFGIGPFEALIQQMLSYQDKLQLIVVCGTNKNLFERLRGRSNEIPGKIYGFVDNMDELMEASDLVVSKTGGLTTCESLAKIVPMAVSKPIPGQETRNALFLEKKECCFRINRPEDIRPILEEIFKPASGLNVVGQGPIEKRRENIKKIRKPHAARDIADFLVSLGKHG